MRSVSLVMRVLSSKIEMPIQSLTDNFSCTQDRLEQATGRSDGLDNKIA